MSARRSPVERDARELAGAALRGAWRRRRDTSVTDVFLAAIQSRQESTTWAVQRGDIPAARRQARAAELLSESLDRLLKRQKRDVAAELARTGIAGGARVVVVHAGYSPNAAPVGTVLTLEATPSHYMFGNDDDGHRWIVYSGNVEVVPDAPMPHDVVERAEQRLMDQGYADDEDMVEVPMPPDGTDETIPCNSCGRDHVPDAGDPTQMDTCWECQQVPA